MYEYFNLEEQIGMDEFGNPTDTTWQSFFIFQLIDFQVLTADELIEQEEGYIFDVYGCTDNSACNFDANANTDDGSCILELDCAGTCGGTAQLDNCGVCDSDLSNDCVPDCAGVWGGLCEECDCAGVCRGFSVLSGCDNVCNSTAVDDCAGLCGGSAVDDCTGVCGGSAVDDCTGVCGGSLLNICIGFDTNIQDSCLVYDGFWSELGFDACGVCGGDNSSCNDECPDITTTSSDCSAPWSQSCLSQCNDHCSLQIDYEGNPCIVVGMGTDCIDHECYCNCEPNSGGILDP